MKFIPLLGVSALISLNLNVVSWNDCLGISLEEIARFGVDSPSVSVNWSPNGEFLAVSGQGRVTLVDENSEVVTQLPLESNDPPAMSTVWGHNSEQAATLIGDGRVIFWNILNGEIQGEWRSHYQTSVTIDWSLDGSRIAVGSWNGKIAIYDVVNSMTEERQINQEDFFTVNSLSWHPVDQLLAFPGFLDSRNDVLIWDVDADRLVERLYDNNAYIVNWSPDGSSLAVGSTIAENSHQLGSVYLWQSEGGRTLHLIPNDHENIIILSLQWHPDGRWLAVLGSDGQVLIWDVAKDEVVTRTELGWRLPPSDLPSNDALAWHPNGNQIAGVDTNGNVKIWQFEVVSAESC